MFYILKMEKIRPELLKKAIKIFKNIFKTPLNYAKFQLLNSVFSVG